MYSSIVLALRFNTMNLCRSDPYLDIGKSGFCPPPSPHGKNPDPWAVLAAQMKPTFLDTLTPSWRKITDSPPLGRPCGFWSMPRILISINLSTNWKKGRKCLAAAGGFKRSKRKCSEARTRLLLKKNHFLLAIPLAPNVTSDEVETITIQNNQHRALI